MTNIVFTAQPQITLDARRCWDCGRLWAFERGFQRANYLHCPNCAGERIEAAKQSEARANRRANALSGALTRLKRAKP